MTMRITISVFFYLLFLIGPSAAQSTGSYQNDTATVKKLIEKAQHNRFFNPDSSVAYAHEALKLSQLINFKKGEVAAYFTIAE